MHMRRFVAVTGEDAMPATVSTRRALLQKGPALLGTKTYCNLLRCLSLLPTSSCFVFTLA